MRASSPSTNKRGRLVWVTQFHSVDGGVDGFGIGVDERGNAHISGHFSRTVMFGPGERNETTLTSAGARDLYLAKLDKKGSLLWVAQAPGPGDTFNWHLSVDNRGNSYIGGDFYGTATFGLGEPNETTLTATGLGDLVLAKYNDAGRLAWVRSAGGPEDDEGYAVAVDDRGNSYITGYFGGTAVFGAGQATETALSASGFIDAYVAKYDSDGSLAWARRVGGPPDAVAFGIGVAVNRPGDVYVTGGIGGAATFGAGETNEIVLASDGVGDGFVAAYDSDGHLRWADRIGGPGDDVGYDIALSPAAVDDEHGNRDLNGQRPAREIAVIGLFEDTVTFATGKTEETNLTSAGLVDMFVAQLRRR